MGRGGGGVEGMEVGSSGGHLWLFHGGDVVGELTLLLGVYGG